MIKALFTHPLYIKINQNSFAAKNLALDEGWKTLSAPSPFTTERLLVGQFSVAAPLLASLIKDLQPKALLKKSAKVLIHPMAMVEGGLSEVEQRIFKELALGAGAYKVILHVGKELSYEEALALLNQA